MIRHVLSVSTPSALMLFLALGAAPVSGQESRPGLFGGDTRPTVLAMEEAGDVLRMTVGHSKLLQSDEAFGTIIVGDDTIANATLGAGNSIIVTGLQAGSTNLIVLSESQQMLMSSTIAVAPVAGALRSLVTVRKGAGTPELYECRGNGCTLTSLNEQPQEMSFLLTPAPQQAAAGGDAAAIQ